MRTTPSLSHTNFNVQHVFVIDQLIPVYSYRVVLLQHVAAEKTWKSTCGCVLVWPSCQVAAVSCHGQRPRLPPHAHIEQEQWSWHFELHCVLYYASAVQEDSLDSGESILFTVFRIWGHASWAFVRACIDTMQSRTLNAPDNDSSQIRPERPKINYQL